MPTQRFDLRNVIREAERTLIENPRASGIGHPGSIGAVREELLGQIIGGRLPRSLGLVHGAELVTKFDRSPQVDLAIFDAEVPPLAAYGSHAVLAGESVRGVIEVKSTLSGSSMEEAYDQLYESRALTSHFSSGPAGGWIVGYRNTTKLTTLRDRLAARQASHEARHWLDGVWVLGTGAIVWADERNRPEPRPFGGGRLRVLRSDDTLFLMLWLMTERLRDDAPKTLNLLAYTSSAAGPPPFWDWVD